MAFDCILGTYGARDWSLGGNAQPSQGMSLATLAVLVDREIAANGELALTLKPPEAVRAGFAGFFKRWQASKKNLGPLPSRAVSLTPRLFATFRHLQVWRDENAEWGKRMRATSVTQSGNAVTDLISRSTGVPTWPTVIGVGLGLGFLGWFLGRK